MNYIGILERQLMGMGRTAIEMLPSLAIGVVLLFVTAMVARGAVKLTGGLTGRSHIRNDLKELIQTLTKLLVWIIGVLLVMTIVVPGFTFGGMVAGLGIGALAIGFAFQDIFENFLAGVLIMLREKMHIGDTIEAEGVDGTVEKITLRETHVRQFSGELTILPNSMIFKNAVKIVTDPGTRRFQLMVGVSYDADLAQSQQVIRDAVASVDGLMEDKGVDVFAREFGASSIDFLVRWWVDTRQNSLFTVHNDVVFAIKQALDAAEIEIPYPYVTHTFAQDVPIAATKTD
ncbi:mechanosensitive ion channel family protein [Pelagerythrobacter sp.]|uniref:mechanosensitive ion channel family protein n=1 Tax=Pelagerythrobacter sp. TaxID=2800702 RepID=UPI0035B146FC